MSEAELRLACLEMAREMFGECGDATVVIEAAAAFARWVITGSAWLPDTTEDDKVRLLKRMRLASSYSA